MEGITANCTNCATKFYINDPLHVRGPKIPLILVCGHTICEKCLSTAFRQTGEIECLKCSHKSNKGDVNLQHFNELTKEFPINLHLLGYFSKNHARQAPVKDPSLQFIPAGAPIKSAFKVANRFKPQQAADLPKMCDECPNTEAVWDCKQCNLVYCNKCYTQVHQFKSTKTHVKTALVNMTDPSDPKHSSTLKTSRQCTEHPTQNLDFFCRDCVECVCSYCIVPLDSCHREHDVVMVQKMSEEYMPKLREVVDSANVIVQNLINAELTLSDKNEIQDSSSHPLKERTSVAVLAQQVANHFAWLHGILQKNEAHVLDKLNRVREDAQQLRTAVRGQVTQCLAHAKDVLQEADAILRKTDSAACSNIVAIIEDVQKIHNFPCQLVLEQQAEELRLAISETFVAELENHCMLEIPAPQSLALVTLDQPIEDGWSLAAVPECHLPVEPQHPCGSVRAPGSQAPSSRASSVSEGDLLEPLKFLADGPPPTRGYISPRTQEVVRLCHIRDPTLFYVLRIPDAKYLGDISQRLQRCAVKQRQPDPNQVKEGQLFLVEYAADRKWYRGRVRSVRVLDDAEALVEVLYVDHGNFEVVSMKRLRTLPLEFTVIPSLALRCTMDKVSPRGGRWLPDAIKWFAKVTNGVQVLCTVYKIVDGVFSVDIGQVPNNSAEGVPLSVTDALIFLEYAQYTDQSGVPSLEATKPAGQVKEQIRFYEDRDFKQGDKFFVVVSHVDSPHHMYIQRTDDALLRYLVQITDELTEIYTRQPRKTKENKLIYSPSIGMACAAHYAVDGRWYRAKVVALPGNKKVEVLFVDYGNKDTVLYTEIRYLRQKHLNIPALALCCSMADVAPLGDAWTPDASRFMIESTRDKVFEVLVESNVLSDVMKIVLYEVKPSVTICFNALLVRAGHARCTGKAANVDDFYRATEMPAPAEQKAAPMPTAAARSGVEVKGTPVEEPIDPYRIEVKVMAATSPSAMIVSIMDYAPIIEKMNEELQTFYNRTSPDPDHKWTIGDKCAVFYDPDQKWYRGTINALPEGEAAVVLMRDIAVKAEVKRGFLRCLDRRFQQVNDGSISCQLAGVVPAGSAWPNMACEFMVDFLKTQKTVFVTKRGDITNHTLPVELYKCEEYSPGPTLPTIKRFTSLNVELVNAGLAIPVRGASDIPSTTSEEVMKELKSRNQDLKWQECGPRLSADTSAESMESDDAEQETGVLGSSRLDWLPVPEVDMVCFEASPTYVDSAGYIYFHDHLQAREQVQKIQENLQVKFADAASMPVDWDWVEGEICVAKYHLDKNWYRARTLYPDVNGDWTVVFVDYGNEEVCSPRDMRRTDYLWDVPIQCHKSILENVGPRARDGQWTTDALDFLHASVVDHKCTVNMKSPMGTPDPIKVQLVRYDGLNISAYLVENNFARYTVVGGKIARPPGQPYHADMKIEGKKSKPNKTKPLLNGSRGSLGSPKLKSSTSRFNSALDHYSSSSSTDDFKKPDFYISLSNPNNIASANPLHKGSSLVADSGTSIDSAVSCSQANSADLLEDLANSESSTSTTPDIESSPEHSDEDDAVSDAVGSSAAVQTLGGSYATGRVRLSDFYDCTYENKEGVGESSCDTVSNDLPSENIVASAYVYHELPSRDELQISVQSVQSPSYIMVYVMTDDSSQALEKITNLEFVLSAEASKQPQLHQPSPGMPCVALFKRGKSQWLRGEVTKVDSAYGLITVLSVDHGKIETLPLDRVVQAKFEWLSLPATVRPCKLWHITAAEECELEDVNENLLLILNDKTLTAVVKEVEPVLTVDILDSEGQGLIYQNLIDARLLCKTE